MRNADAVSALERDLRTIFGSRLQSLVAYGVESSADGPVTTLAIVEQLAAADLQACAHRVASWRVRGLGTPLVLEAREFGRSLDAFPFEFGNILADHVETVAPYLVERMLASTKNGDEISWLTTGRMMKKFMGKKEDKLARYGL